MQEIIDGFLKFQRDIMPARRELFHKCELSPLRNQTVFGVKAPGTFRRLGATSLSAYRRR